MDLINIFEKKTLVAYVYQTSPLSKENFRYPTSYCCNSEIIKVNYTYPDDGLVYSV